jgi:hypothetical protein
MPAPFADPGGQFICDIRFMDIWLLIITSPPD